jgi:hypothetical protein
MFSPSTRWKWEFLQLQRYTSTRVLSTMTWPPETVTIQTDDLINQCELMEVHPTFAEGKQYLPVSVWGPMWYCVYPDSSCLTF